MLSEDNRAPRAIEGRERLLDAAEILLDRHGLDGVSARAITQAAGHRNNAAVHYHFGTRAELVVEVLVRRRDALDIERHRLIDELEAAGPVDPVDAVKALVSPTVPLLADPGGRRYVRLLSQAASHPMLMPEEELRHGPSIRRALKLALPLLDHLPRDQRIQRISTAAASVLLTLAQQAWLIDADDPPWEPMDPAVLEQELITTTLAVLRG